MINLTFKSDKKRQNHPCARLINPYLMEKFFYRSLTELEINMLQGNGPAIPKEQIQRMPYEKRQRLFICLLLNPTSLSSHQLFNVNVNVFKIDKIRLAKLSAMAGRFDLLSEIRDQNPEINLHHTLTKDDVLFSIAASMTSADSFISVLNYKLNDDTAFKNLINTADLQTIYQWACRDGHLHVIEYLEEIEDFDKKAVVSANDYDAYPLACSNGHLHVINHLEKITGFDKKAAASANNYVAYRRACEEGHLHIIEHLEKITGFDKNAAVSVDNYAAYRKACSNGHLHVIKHLEKITGFDQKATASAHNYDAYRIACVNGHLHVIEHLDKIAGFDKKAAVSADNYDAYRIACGNGHLHVMKHLEKITGFDKTAAVSADNYAAYYRACMNGHLHVIKHLEKITGFDKKATASAFNYMTNPGVDNYDAYRIACENGHLHVIENLEKITGFDKKAAARASSYLPYFWACVNGHIHIIEHLEKITGFNKKVAASVNKYVAYIYACEGGRLHIMEHLEKITGFDKNAAARARDYAAYRGACMYGHLYVIEHLEKIANFDKNAAVSADNYSAYCEACSNGHLQAIEHLEKITGFDKSAAIRANDYAAFRCACERRRSNVVNHLLKNINCLNYAESHDMEYGKRHVYGFFDMNLRLLKAEKALFQAESPHGVFDVPNEDSRRYFYMLRNLIRRGVDRNYASAFFMRRNLNRWDVDRNNTPAENLQDDILFLLSIPSIKALCHQSVGENGQENELLRLAMSIGNTDATRVLLNIDAVRQLAERHDYYQNERQNGVDIRQLAQSRESSMTALTEGEQSRLARIERLYGPLQKKIGFEQVFHDLKLKLEDKYDSDPAKITRKTGTELTLPRYWKAFQALRLSGEEHQKALKAYYQNNAHTALRYVSKPNHWIAKNSSFVYVNPDTPQERWSTFEEYKPLMTLLYLAAVDENSNPTQGYTVESRFEHFVSELALIGRAHNWDKTRERKLKDGSVIQEEYDDLEGDKPSCYSGVKRRLFQSLKGHESFEVLTPEVVALELQSFYRKAFNRIIESKDISTADLVDILSNYYEMSLMANYDYQAFSKISINNTEKNDFMAGLMTKYGAAIQEFQTLIKAKLEKYKSAGQQRYFVDNAIHYGLLGLLCKKIFGTQEGMILALNHATLLDNTPPDEIDNIKNQLLQLDSSQFSNILNNLKGEALIKLLMSQNHDQECFINQVLKSDRLKPLVQQKFMQKKWLNKLLNLSNYETQFDPMSPRAFEPSPVEVIFQQATRQLVSALVGENTKLSISERDELMNNENAHHVMALISKVKGISVEALYDSITDKKPSAAP